MKGGKFEEFWGSLEKSGLRFQGSVFCRGRIEGLRKTEGIAVWEELSQVSNRLRK